ncbi:hypothetical protein L1049_010295 [Liquidambar formosana]|uniref:DNA repair protein RAD16 n=1 Tax=Liquidambar formosana TaxID=63359 RepID=A0AAP0N7A4_LIQFO
MKLRSSNPAFRAKRRPVKESSDEEDVSGDEVSAPHSESDGNSSSDEGEEELNLVIQEDVCNDDLKEDGPKEDKPKKGRRNKPKLQWKIWEEEDERFINGCEEEEKIGLSHLDEEIADTAEAPPDMLVPLLRYQKEWLAWALKQEESACRGGILADEMGMGKTIQAIVLVLAKRAILNADVGQCEGLPSSSLSKEELQEIKCTLVVCPLAALIQWKNEIARCTPQGSTKVLVYHGTNKKKIVHDFSHYDFVLTTYSTLEAEYRKNGVLSKVKCEYCGKSCFPERLTSHLAYYCSKSTFRTRDEVREFLKQRSNSFQLNSNLASIGEEKRQNDGVREKGGGCKRKQQHKKKKVETSVDQCQSLGKVFLHSVKWLRIILDEAQIMKDRRSNTTIAINALESSYKWALSGTPFQNNLSELYPLVRFLQILPYSYYFCWSCDCKLLSYIPSIKCACTHERHFCWWNKYIIKPRAFHGISRRGVILLKQKLLKSIMLRRTKERRAADLALPPRIVKVRRDALDIKEEDYYNALYKECQSEFNTYVEAGTLMNNYVHLFELLTRLRQALDHPYLVVYSKTSELRTNADQKCGICLEAAEDRVVTSCGHIFCKVCLMNFSETLGEAVCPSCSTPLTVDATIKLNAGDRCTNTVSKGHKSSSILDKICLEDFQTSTKIDALKEEIRFMVEVDGSAKAIVFSQFTSFLDLINYSFQKSGISCVKLVGSMTLAARDAAVKRFNDDPDCKIFLMSLKAGGVALNLMVASNVFLMDPWWNPSVERQAFDRIHRIGQYKPIRIVKFIIENTIEEKILALQEKKERVLRGALSGSADSEERLTYKDWKDLFA